MKSKQISRAVFIAIPLLMVISVCSLMGQSAGTGALTGTVRDPTGAVVPNATVTLTSTDTNQVRSSVTGADGNYKFSLLQPGTYRVRFVAVGFKSAEVPSVTVNVTETPVLDRTLELGAQSEQVTVQAEVGALQTANSTLGTTVGTRTLTSLPLSSRNYTQILALCHAVRQGHPDHERQRQ